MAVITVSREYGSRGEEIAQQIAKELTYSYFGKEILTEVASAAQTTEERISSYDERDEHGLRAFLKNLFKSYPVAGMDFPHYYPPATPLEWSFDYAEKEAVFKREPVLDAEEVTEFFREVIEKLWERDNVVIIGRGSQKILAAKPKTLHVRFIAPMSDRTKAVMDSEQISDKEAIKKIEAIDKLRAHYLKHHYDANWSNPKLYHLILNTGFLSDSQAVKIVVAAVRHLASETGS